MSTIRVLKDKDYFVAANAPFNNKELSWEARGVLAYLLSKDDGWSIRNEDLYKQGPAGRTKMDRIIKELKDCGHLVRIKSQLPSGKFAWTSILYETIPRNRNDGSRNDGKPDNIISTESLSTDSKRGTAKPPPTKPKAKKKKERDPMIDHPAIVIYKDKVRYSVPVMWRAKVVAAVGDRAKEWGEHIDQWIGLGWKPTNVSGMVDAFKNGGIGSRPGRNGNNVHKAQPVKPGRTKEEMKNAKPLSN